MKIHASAEAIVLSKSLASRRHRMQFTNYLSLLKIEGAWKIVSKLYHLHK